MTDEANAFLMSGGAGRSASFEKEKDRVWGVIMGYAVRQQTEYQTRKPMFWPDGNPMNELVVTLLTDDRVDDEDDGLRKVYVKGQMQQAVQKAVIAAGETGLSEGGRLLVQFVSTAVPRQRGMNGAKQYFAKYEPPVVSTPLDDGTPPPIDPDDLPF